MSQTDLVEVLIQQDARTEFRNVTFSGYRKADVLRELTQALEADEVEAACTYCAELVLAGHFVDLWHALIDMAASTIHVHSPLVFVYLHVRLTHFRTELNELRPVDPVISLREGRGVRDMFTEIAYVLGTAPKAVQHLAGLATAVPASILENVHGIADRFRAPSRRFAEAAFVEGVDAPELFIACNELAYAVSRAGRAPDATLPAYWAQWICQRAESDKLRGAERPHLGVAAFETATMRAHPVWLVWDVLLREIDRMVEGAQAQLKPVASALLGLFALKLTARMVRRKMTLVFAAIQLLVVPYADYAPFPRIIPHKDEHQEILRRCPSVYFAILRGGCAPP